ncbi:MAG: sulfatase-like hydrolase/transferase [Acidobacteriota bacterium]|nr:sulfatase-like hydrolase/transferase [Acidobacteriota bacterium]
MSRILTSAVVVAGISLCNAPFVSAADNNLNLLLITLDTVRADYLSCNGSKKAQTPHLDRLARAGVNFTRARTSVPLTLPAHASIMTGNYPPVHGVRDNGSYRLPQEQLTLAEVLDGHGYETAAFIGAFVLDRDFGLAQGFDVYDEGVWGSASVLEDLIAERSADAVRDAFSSWLEGRAGEGPFFAWIHLYDPHAPYVPPQPFRKRYAENPYVGEIAYTDAVVGKIVEDLESEKLLGSTLIAVVGDHGESLGEHGEQTHSLLIYNSTIHVPMLLSSPGLIPSGKTVDHLSRTIDLAPTILDYLGISQTIGQGKSLRPLVEGGSPDEEILAYSESLYPSLNLGWSELRGLEAGDYRFILAPRSELYDLTKDPGERENRTDSNPSMADRLEQKLATLMESMGPSVGQARQTVDPQAEEMLRSLGYISTSQFPPQNGPSVVDPKDKIELWTKIESGLALFSQGDDAAALDVFKKALAEDNDIPILYDHIGWSYIRLNQYDRAERVYRQAIEQGFDSAELRANLGLIYYRWREYAKAEQELGAALKLEENNIPAHYRLADVYRSTKKYPNAVTHYRRVLEIDPGYVWALNGLGMALAMERKNEEALTAFREAVRIAPEMAAGYLNLAIHLERMQRFPEALEAYQKFLDLSSEDEFARQRELAASAITRLQAR